jgi:hypothetical protein
MRCIKFRSILALSIYALIALLGGYPAALAFTAGERKDIELRTFYDPTDLGSCVAEQGSDYSQIQTGKIYMVGDSITEGTNTELTAAFKQKGFTDIQINGKSSRRLSEGSGELDGVSVIAADKARMADAKVAVIALGTNSGVSSANVTKAVAGIKAGAPGAKIYWVNIGVNNAKRDAADINTAPINEALGKSATVEGFTMVDWASVVSKNPNFISDDGLGVHPFTATGKAGFAKTVADGLAGVSTSTATASGPSCSSAISSGTDLSGNDNAEKVFNFLKGKGLTPIQIAGIMGNLQAESGFNPGIEEKGVTRKDKGYGLAQWTFGRRTNLENYATAAGKPASDLGVQLEFLWFELNDAYKANTLDVILASSSLEECTYVFLTKFERPADIPGNKPIRLGFAQNILNQPWAK